jgi:uncharacterized DUF497 family protein
MPGFSWDARKATANERKHGVSFDLAREVFDDPRALIDLDPEPSEERWRIIGQIHGGRQLLFVVFLENEDDASFHIISARQATRRESKRYLDQ